MRLNFVQVQVAQLRCHMRSKASRDFNKFDVVNNNDIRQAPRIFLWSSAL